MITEVPKGSGGHREFGSLGFGIQQRVQATKVPGNEGRSRKPNGLEEGFKAKPKKQAGNESA